MLEQKGRDNEKQWRITEGEMSGMKMKG